MKTKMLCVLSITIVIFSVVFQGCKTKGVIVIGSLKTADALVVSEMYAKMLEKKGYAVTRKFDFENERALHEAILDGSIAVGAEYSGAALTRVLGADRAGDQYATYDALSARYRAQGLVLLEPLPANNAWTIAVLQETAAAKGLKTFTDIRDKADELAIAVTAEFKNDGEGYPLLEEVYGTFGFKNIVIADENEQHNLLLQKKIDVIAVRSNNGRLAGSEYKTLRDNFHAFIPQTLVPVLKNDFLERHEDIRPLINAVSASLNDKAIIGLNNRTLIRQVTYSKAAKDFLKENNFL